MKLISTILSLLVTVLCSCQGPISYTATSGTKSESFKSWGNFGGSESLRTAGGFELTANRNKNAGQFFQAAGAVAAGYVAHTNIISNNTANTAAGQQLTQQKLDALNAATAQQKIAADQAVFLKTIEANQAIHVPAPLP